MKTASRFRDPEWVRPFGDHARMVREPAETDRILALASHSMKLGGDVFPRRRARIPNRVVYLEEYATCSDECPFKSKPGFRCYTEDTRADRFVVTPQFWSNLDRECRHLNIRHREFWVKLHGSGDFPNVNYVRAWIELASRHTHMHIWGSTAWAPDSPIGREIQCAKHRFGERWRTHWSNRLLPTESTHVFRLRDFGRDAWRDGYLKPHQIVDGVSYFLCPHQLDTMIRNVDPKDATTCANCTYCKTVGGNVGWLLHSDF